jgi:hypothetical protein
VVSGMPAGAPVPVGLGFCSEGDRGSFLVQNAEPEELEYMACR